MITVTCVPEVIQILEATYPRLKVELKVATSAALAEVVNALFLDLAILADPQVKSDINVEEMAFSEVAWGGASSKHIGSSS